MNPTSESIERIKARARLVLAAALGLALLLAPPRGTLLFPLVGFIFGVYFLYAGVALLFYRQLAEVRWQVAMVAGDAAALVVVLLLGPRHPAPFLFFFVYFTLVAGLWRGWPAAAGLSLAVSAAYLWVAWKELGAPAELSLLAALPRESWVVVLGLVAAGSLVGTVAQRERQHIERAAVVERFAHLLSLEIPWPELWRRWLGELCRRYRARRALLAYRDPETDRVLLSSFQRDQEGEHFEESDRPPRDARTFLLDAEPHSWLANGLDQSGAQEWHRKQEDRTTRGKEPQLPPRLASEFSPGSLLTVPVAVGGRWSGRLFLLDAEQVRFEREQLDDLHKLVTGLEPVLANLLTIRSLITRAVNQERDSICRTLHDGVAQTLASLEMQLDLYRRSAVEAPARTGEELSRLQSVVKHEQEELRRFLRTLKPVRVSASELNRWVLAHCAQFQQETGIKVDVEAEPVDTTLPEGVCREVFLLLREALHNVHKHAGAQNVLVRLRQTDNYLRLLVDDDGRGFPFSGTYSEQALEEKGLVPLSLREHTRAVDGVLTIDSTPGSGSTVRVEIPLT